MALATLVEHSTVGPCESCRRIRVLYRKAVISSDDNWLTVVYLVCDDCDLK